ncbi:alcohol dehydrogenase [Thozetella sp. PMI_491]|nr:alcohol dehydrogenase [Thozetella sp. PMI_491]
MSSLPKTYKAAVITTSGAPLEIQDVELKLPGPGEVLLKVLACGVCYSDYGFQQGHMGEPWPRIPGHEFIGDVVALGEGVTRFSIGDRLGGAWHGGHDSVCSQCVRGRLQMCDNKAVNGITRDGGFAEYAALRAEAAVRIPRDVDPAEAAPLLCAGVTVFNGIRRLGIQHGDLVAVQGLGGLGHLAVQFAKAMGYRVVAISRGEDKRAFATQLGAFEYIDGAKEDVGARLKELGGAALVVATAPNPAAVSPLIYGIAPMGKLLVLPVLGPVPFDTTVMVINGISVHGWPSGHALDSEETIRFAQEKGVKCMVEKMPLAEATQALLDVAASKPKFRSVLVME